MTVAGLGLLAVALAVVAWFGLPDRWRCGVKVFLTLPHAHCLYCCRCEDCKGERARAWRLGIAVREPKP